MKRHQNIQKEIPISEKVKKMFRYSPSYDAQKCYSKLPLRNNNIHAIAHSFKNHEIDCQYSSVKQKNFQTNQCNDNSSWIAKLVNGIQDEDQDNKVFHRLSQIENNSVTDLPEDSQDYGYNQFFMEPGEQLFVQKQVTQNQMTDKFDKQPSIIKPMKKSIKQVMIQIQMKQNNEGIGGPPVTRDNSYSKRQNHSKKHNQRQTISQPAKYLHRLSEDNKMHSNKNVRSSLLSKKPKLDIKKITKNHQKKSANIIQASNQKKTNSKQRNKSIKVKSQNEEATFQQQTCKRSLISSSTQKQRIQRIRYETEELPTRKNSFANKECSQLFDEKLNDVQANNNNFNMNNLFDESNQTENKQNSQYSTTQSLSQGIIRKRIGSIKKNKKGDDILKLNNFQSKEIKNDLNKLQSTSYKNLQCFKSNQIKILIKRDYNNLTLNRKNYDPCNSIDTQSNKLFQQDHDLISKYAKIQLINSNRIETCSDQYKMNTKREEIQKEKLNSIESLNYQRIRSIFNKIRLDQTNRIVSKKNLKLRGLTEVQKNELGSIISKIHYQSAQYNFQDFQNEFRKINIQCTLNGCLSHQKIRSTFENNSLKQTKKLPKDIIYPDHSQNQTTKNQSLKHFQNDRYARSIGSSSNQEVCFQQVEYLESIKHDITDLSFKNRNFQVPKKKLFEQIQTISNFDKFTSNQLPRHSKSNQETQQNVNVLQQRIFNQQIYQKDEKEQSLSKDPYIQGPSVVDIQIPKKDKSFFKNLSTVKILGVGHNMQRPIEADLFDVNDNRQCLIQRLNKKLSSYIDKNHIQSTYRQFDLNFSQLKKHIR